MKALAPFRLILTAYTLAICLGAYVFGHDHSWKLGLVVVWLALRLPKRVAAVREMMTTTRSGAFDAPRVTH